MDKIGLFGGAVAIEQTKYKFKDLLEIVVAVASLQVKFPPT